MFVECANLVQYSKRIELFKNKKRECKHLWVLETDR
jgi:hypothetical protein